MNDYMNSQDEPSSTIHVRSLGEFDYCPRAGVFAFDCQVKDNVDDEPNRIPNLGYSAPFEIELVKQHIKERLSRLGRASILLIAILMFSALIGRTYGFGKTAPIWMASILPMLVIMVALQDLATLWKEQRGYELATSPTPLNEGPRIELEVDWWQLVKLYDAISPQRNYFDLSTGLIGRPKRLLTFHNQRIPVIFSSSKREGGIKSTHIIKLAAYCSLLNVSEKRAICDWGIVMFENRTGFAIPITPADISQMHLKLKDFKNTIQSDRHGNEPAKGHPKACVSCPLNHRREYRKGKTETKMGGVVVLSFVHPEDKTHCSCGDRFQWCPPVAYDPSK